MNRHVQCDGVGLVPVLLWVVRTRRSVVILLGVVLGDFRCCVCIPYGIFVFVQVAASSLERLSI